MDDLLPSNRTALETALSVAMGPRLLTEDLGIVDLKTAPKPQIVPWLVWEYGLSELQPYVAGAELLRDGVRFQRIRGSTQAIKTALGWLGLPDAVVEQEIPGIHSAEIQIDPGRVLTVDEARRVQAVFDLAKPARARLSRIYHGCDRRHFKLDRRKLYPYNPDDRLPAAVRDGSVLDTDILDADSGVRLWEGGPLLAFCQHQAGVALWHDPPDLPVSVRTGPSLVAFSAAKSNAEFRLDFDRLDDWLPQAVDKPGITSLQFMSALQISIPRIWDDIPWSLQPGTWADFPYWTLDRVIARGAVNFVYGGPAALNIQPAKTSGELVFFPACEPLSIVVTGHASAVSASAIGPVSRAAWIDAPWTAFGRTTWADAAALVRGSVTLDPPP